LEDLSIDISLKNSSGCDFTDGIGIKKTLLTDSLNRIEFVLSSLDSKTITIENLNVSLIKIDCEYAEDSITPLALKGEPARVKAIFGFENISIYDFSVFRRDEKSLFPSTITIDSVETVKVKVSLTYWTSPII
jgi:hypothetical protein